MQGAARKRKPCGIPMVAIPWSLSTGMARQLRSSQIPRSHEDLLFERFGSSSPSVSEFLPHTHLKTSPACLLLEVDCRGSDAAFRPGSRRDFSHPKRWILASDAARSGVMRFYEGDHAYEIERIVDPMTQLFTGWRYRVYRIRPDQKVLGSGEVETREEAEKAGRKALAAAIRQQRAHSQGKNAA